MSLCHWFETSHIHQTTQPLQKKSDLAVIDTEGHAPAVRDAVKRGVYVYGYK